MCAKISVIIPVYNKADYIQECLDTVKEQTLKEIEIICVNDGSTDNSAEIIEKNVEDDQRIILINKENGGAASARNRGLEIAKGEFVIFMDPDDWYPESDILETLYNTAKKHNVLICGGSFSEVSEERGLVTTFKGIRRKYTFEEDGLIQYKDYQFDYGYHRFIYNLQFLKENNIFFPLYLRFQDPPFFVKAMITAKEFYAIKKIVYRYRAGYQEINWTEKKLVDLLKGLRDNIKMSGEEELAELHKITIDRLAKSYKDMYAKAIGDSSSAILKLLMETQTYINLDLLKNTNTSLYENMACDIVIRAIELQKRDIKKWEKKYKGVVNSKAFKISNKICKILRKLKFKKK